MFSIPNKPPISLTPRAVSHIKLLMDNSDALALRVGVKKGGCAGMEYTIEYVTELDKNDEVIEQDGVRVLIAHWDSQNAEEKPKIGRWLGVSHNVGSALCYFVLTEKGNVISRTSVQHFTTDDVSKPETQQAMRDYHANMHKHIKSRGFRRSRRR